METPRRFAEMVAEQLAYAAVPNEEIARAFDKTFSSPESDMVVVKDISLFSHCEHHIALMYNMKAAVGYIPRGASSDCRKLPASPMPSLSVSRSRNG